MDLTQAMFAATQDPPPTGIDVDQLITGERRRTRRLHAVTGFALAAALTVGAVALPQYLSRTPSGQSPGLAPPLATRSAAACVVPSPTVNVTPGAGKEPTEARPLVPVTETCGDAINRLSDAITALLPHLAPDATFTNIRDGSAPPAKVERDPRPVTGYMAGLKLRSGASLSVMLEASEETPAQFRAFTEEQCSHPGGRCRRDATGGAELLIRNDVGYGIDVWAVRADGTRLLVLARGPAGDPPPFTEQQLIELVTAPELTLYP